MKKRARRRDPLPDKVRGVELGDWKIWASVKLATDSELKSDMREALEAFRELLGKLESVKAKINLE